MKVSIIRISAAALVLAVFSLTGYAQKKADIKGEIEKSQKAAKVFEEITSAPDKGIPQSIFDDARCVAVFPSVIKAGFIVGGRGGSGVASCRGDSGWTGPAYLNLAGGSVGLQIGAQATDFVFLFMTRESMDRLLSSKFTIGADASAAAGPVGRQAGAETDVKLKAEILSYSRSRGLFAGVELKGVVISTDDSDMRHTFGENVSVKDVLEGRVQPPPEIRTFPETLARYSSTAKAVSTRQK